ncbi:MAG TPA: type II toxin-antitoxin system VapC family toxin [Terriglobales bacterium]|nr:type II toxin-antitoxin system VapC family toxin [Terriglobales bacterium]
MNAADTNVVVRLLVRDDVRQTAVAERFVARGAWVSLLVLLETCWVLGSSYGFGTSELGEAVAMLLQHDRLVLEQPALVSAALEEFRVHGKVGFADCLILEAARGAGNLPLGTFDRELAELADTQRLR